MKRGDILLIHYYFDPVGFIIRRLTHSHWNHVAWVIDNKNVVESCRKGVIITPISKYLNKWFYNVKLVRINDISDYKLDKAIKMAQRTKRRRNYFKLILTFLFIYLRLSDKLPRTTCSGLIAYCLSKVDFYFKKSKHPLYITPADISNSKGVKDVSKEL